MRRSSAPSSLPGSKRPKFQTPFLLPSSQQRQKKQQEYGGERQDQNMASLPSNNECPASISTRPIESAETSLPLTKSKLQETLSKIRKNPNQSVPTSSYSASSSGTSPESGLPNTSDHTSVTKFQAPPKSSACLVSSKSSDSDQFRGTNRSSSSNDGHDSIYYNVMWCKRSNKKHKTWEGDAILIVRGSKVSLKDMDGKSIGCGIGYKKSEVSDLTEGSTLIIGGKEIEVMNEMSDEDWKSGKCFTGTGCEDTVPDKPAAMITKKSNPFQSRRNEQGPLAVSPLFNPTVPGALVMPRPSPKHQLEWNSRGLGLVDVVVDPHLSIYLRPHQREGVIFLYQCVMGMKRFHGQGVILADEMGLGKTLQCISIVWTLLKQGPYGMRPIVKKIIIITPGSLVKNWEKEFCKWLGTERLKVYPVSGDVKVEGFISSPLYPVLIISYEMFLRSHDALSAVKFDLLICDEGHRLKNAEAKTTSVIGRLATRKRILLTGTPIQNDLHEFYSIIDFCNPSVLGSHSAFQRVYEGPIVLSRQPGASSEEKEVGRARTEELKRLTSLFCLRRTQDIINRFLPPKVDNIVFCRMSSLQLSLYKHLLSSRLIRSCFTSSSHSTSEGHFPPHLICIGALKKLCNSPSLIYDAALEKRNSRPVKSEDTDGWVDSETLYSNVLELFPDGYDSKDTGVQVADDGCGKLAVLSEMLRQLFSTTNEKVVVVSNYTQMLDILERLCLNQEYKFLRLDGSTPSSKRQSIVERFNSKHGIEKVFLLSSKAGGVGLNLIGGSRLILYDIDWNPANDLQAMARIWRDGQKRKVHIYRLLTTGSIEEKIFQRQITKQGLNTLLDFHGDNVAGTGGDHGSSGSGGSGGGGKTGGIKFTREELRDLFTLREDTLCDTHDLVRCECGSDGGQNTGTGSHPTDQAHNSGVNELLQWHHFKSPVDHTSLSDELLTEGASCKISYVFQTETISSDIDLL